jgi:hypothetical protein
MIRAITNAIKFVSKIILNIFMFILALFSLIGSLALGIVIPVLVVIILGCIVFALLF